jgi:hypothetical protein
MYAPNVIRTIKPEFELKKEMCTFHSFGNMLLFKLCQQANNVNSTTI